MTSWPWMKGVAEAVTSAPIDPVTEHDKRPLVRDLIEKHRDKIDKIKAEVSQDPLYDPDKHDDLWMLRFWMSHKKSKAAIKAAKSTLSFRQKYNLDDEDIRDTPPHKVTQGRAAKYFQNIPPEGMWLSLPDKRRGVVAFIKIKSIDYRELIKKVSAEDWVHNFVYLSEWTHQWVDYVTRTTGRLTKTVRILDISGIGITTMPSESIRRDSQAMAVMEDAYPQMLETVYLCFPAVVFHITWAIAKPLLPKRLIEKMDVIDPVKSDRDRAHLYKHITEENIPKEFGGPNKSYVEWGIATTDQSNEMSNGHRQASGDS